MTVWYWASASDIHINPTGGLRWQMPGSRIHLVVGRRCLRWIGSIEPRPTPAITPQPIAGITPIAIPHHDEPTLQGFGMAEQCLSPFVPWMPETPLSRALRRQGIVRPYNRPRRCRGRCIDDMQFLRTVTLVGCHRPAARSGGSASTSVARRGSHRVFAGDCLLTSHRAMAISAPPAT